MENQTLDSRRMKESTSDQNCSSECGCRLGADHKFELEVNKEQDILDKQGKQMNDLGLKDTEYDLFLPILKDVILNIFTDPEEEKIFKKALYGMREKFLDTLDGSKKSMSLFPEKFDYDSRVKLHNPVVIELLEEMKRTRNDFKEIEMSIKKLKPQAAEELVFNSLARFFFNNRGMFLHSLKLDQYMKIFVDLSAQERKNFKSQENNSLGSQLTPIEKKVKEAFRMTEESLNAPGDAVILVLKQLQPESASSVALNIDKSDPTLAKISSSTDTNSAFKFKGYEIKNALEDKNVTKTVKKGFTKMAQGKFDDQKDYFEEDVRDILRVCKFHFEARFPGENDFLTILADLKLFVCVEVKCQVDTKAREVKATNSSKSNSQPDLDGNLKSAASQLKKNAYHTAKMHAPILSREWKFLKIAAIIPDIINKQRLCNHCRKWILTEDIIRKPGGLQKWWEETGIQDEIGKIEQQRKEEGYKDYLVLFNRYINLSRIGLQKTTPPRSWEQVQGSNTSYISAGYTNPSTSNPIGFKDAQNRPLDAFKILCYEPDQEELLTTMIPRIVFLCDFGSGK